MQIKLLCWGVCVCLWGGGEVGWKGRGFDQKLNLFVNFQ